MVSKDNGIIYYILIFFIGAVAGFIYEEIFTYIFDHELVNRGFLYGPYLPVYGFGACLIVLLLERFKKNPLIYFVLCMCLTGVVEYITGLILNNIWHMKLWDYTGLFMNISGYVCLRSVLTFAVGGLILVYIVLPYVKKFLCSVSRNKVNMFIILFLSLFAFDFMITIIYRY